MKPAWNATWRGELREAEKANIPFLAALPGALRRCSSLVWLATLRSERLALHPASAPKNGTLAISVSLRTLFQPRSGKTVAGMAGQGSNTGGAAGLRQAEAFGGCFCTKQVAMSELRIAAVRTTGTKL